ncbi:hypothetical protein [Xylocopilactobacillus apis]|uniref:Uncharacterized protein n=1 Tax=Xylocopilactobacillus apis TaxID=2932183 RepID=A0AAU9CWL9_9LACO|nr:hypothetical protein [Xylocopilactobacillus apis]BDR55749.1 hypothetical protein KIMC2_03110 [Xylocopilactobacillus apis]
MQITNYLNCIASNKFEQFILNYISYGSILFFPNVFKINHSYDILKNECDNSSGEDGYEIFSFFIQRKDITDNYIIEVQFYFENYELIMDAVNLDNNNLTLDDFLSIVKNKFEIYLLRDFEDEGVIILNNTVTRFICTENNIFISQIEGAFQKENLIRQKTREEILKKQMKPIEDFKNSSNYFSRYLYEIMTNSND